MLCQPYLNFIAVFASRACVQVQQKSSAELLKNRPGQARALSLFYASLTFRPGPSSPSPGSCHLYSRL